MRTITQTLLAALLTLPVACGSDSNKNSNENGSANGSANRAQAQISNLNARFRFTGFCGESSNKAEEMDEDDLAGLKNTRVEFNGSRMTLVMVNLRNSQCDLGMTGTMQDVKSDSFKVGFDSLSLNCTDKVKEQQMKQDFPANVDPAENTWTFNYKLAPTNSGKVTLQLTDVESSDCASFEQI